MLGFLLYHLLFSAIRVKYTHQQLNGANEMINPLITEYSKLVHILGTTGGTKLECDRCAELAELLKDIIKKSRSKRAK